MKVQGKSPPLDPAQAERLSRPYYYWLLAALFIEYARPASFLPFLQIPLVYSLIPIALLVAVSFARHKGLRPMSAIMGDPLSKWILVYIGLITVSFSYAIIGEFAFNTFKLAFGYTILFFLITRIVTTQSRLAGVVCTLLAAHVFLLAMNPKVITEPETRNYIVGATFLGDGNDFALSLCILVPFAVEIAIGTRKTLHRALIYGVVLLIVFAIIASQSRGASLALGAVFLYLWVKSSHKGASLFGIIVIVLIGLLYAPTNYFDRMKTLADYENEGSAMGRIHIWKAGTRMALDNPVFGVGAGNFPVAYGTKYKAPEATMWKNAHSAYFLVWGELGTLGLVTFFMLTLGNMRHNARVRKAILARAGPKPDETSVFQARRLYVLTAGMLGYMVAGAFLSSAYYPHVFIVTALFVAARDMAITATGVDWRAAVLRRGRARSRHAAELPGASTAQSADKA